MLKKMVNKALEFKLKGKMGQRQEKDYKPIVLYLPLYISID